MGVALGLDGRLVPVRFRNRIDTPSRDQFVKRFSVRYLKRDTRVRTIRLLWSREGRPPFETNIFDVSGQAVNTEAVYELPRDPTKLWDVGVATPPAVDLGVTDLGVLSSAGTSVSGPGSGQVTIILVANNNTTLARTLRVLLDPPGAPRGVVTYTIQAGGRLALALLETVTLFSVTLFDDANTGDLSAKRATLLTAQVVTFAYSVIVEELDATGNVLTTQTASSQLVFADVGVSAPPVPGDALVTGGGSD